jgi:ATP-dependent DNA ligase
MEPSRFETMLVGNGGGEDRLLVVVSLDGVQGDRVPGPRRHRCVRGAGRAVVAGRHYFGREEEGKLICAGKVENGFNGPDLAELKKRLPKLIVPRSPLAKAERRPKAKWVSPEVLVEVAYPNKTDDGRIRHPSFKGLRDLTKR